MAATSSAAESVTSVKLPIYLTALPPQGSYTSAALYTNGSPSFLKIDYGVIGGSATNGVDYLLANGTLTFTNVLLTPAGGPNVTIQSELIQDLAFSVTNDTAVNGSRTIVIKLSNHVENVYVGPTSPFLFRANATASNQDTNFNIGIGPSGSLPDGTVRSIVVWTNNDVFVGGMFTAMKVRDNLARNDYHDPGPFAHAAG